MKKIDDTLAIRAMVAGAMAGSAAIRRGQSKEQVRRTQMAAEEEVYRGRPSK